jgi:signal transduction histidine kinase
VQRRTEETPTPPSTSRAARLVARLRSGLGSRRTTPLAHGAHALPQSAAPSETAPPSQPAKPAPGLGLSSKLLILTVIFVMLAEVLIFLPSIANFRITWLNDRLTSARLASLAADARPDYVVPPAVRQELLSTARVQYVAIKRNDMRRLVLPPEGPIEISRSYDLRRDPSIPLWRALPERIGLIGDALRVLLDSGNETIRVYGHPASPMGGNTWAMNDFVEIVLPEAPLRAAMLTYSLNILALSIIISLIAAALVYAALNRLLVAPILRISRNIEAFSHAPQNASLIIEPSHRTDEIGTTERELRTMQQELRSMLHQKSRLAELGLAVSKISHDLRNILATAQLLSDRLTTAKDPVVQRFAPRLIASLDRAIALCNDTLRYGRAEEAEPRRTLFPLDDLVSEVGEGLALPRAAIAYAIQIDPSVEMDGDRDQIYRILNNVVRNAVQAIEQQPTHDRNEIRVTGRREGRLTICEVLDDGPGIPPKARAGLFRAFHGTTRKGGTGLGLTIAAELAAAHGGRLELVDTPRGAGFRLFVPDRAAAD